MKYSIIFFLTIVILVNVGCKKESYIPATNINEPVIQVKKDSSNPVIQTISPGRITVENLTWIYPWYNAVEIKDFSNMISSILIFKVFIQRAGRPEWKEIPLITSNADPAIEYEYFVEKRPDGAGMYNLGSLYIFYYGKDVSDHPSVKIEY